MAGIYIHVPFCKTRCNYCDFYTQTNILQKQEYIKAVCNEVVLRKEYLGDDPVKTIYWGGGTPSLLGRSDFEKVFRIIYSCFNVDSDAEITIEANPDDLTDEYIKDLTILPFNRISIGIQSFDDQDLKFLNRRHTSAKAISAVQCCQQLGFKNISIDLMYGLPGQTSEKWISNINQAVNLDIQHISAYHLIYEENTPLYKLLQQNQINPVDEDVSVDMFSTMIDTLSEAGFIHYEISNFAKERYYSKHNSSYWLGDKYLGLGAAAHSYDGQNRSWNVSSIKEYVEGIDTKAPRMETEILDMHTRYNDFILTGMRTMWGVDLNKLKQLFGSDMSDYCLKNAQKFIDKEFVSISNDVLKLTRKGIFVSDDIMSELMYIN